MTFKARVRLFGILALLTTTAIATTPIVRAASPATQAAPATCSLSWVGQEAVLEAFMRAAPIAKLEDVPIGVTKPRRAVFEPGGLVRRAAFKPLVPSFRSGFHESYKAEIAAYALDRLLDMHMVPPIVERKIEGQTGALILWIENTTPWNVKKPPSGPDPGWSQQLIRMKMFDQLIANIDRNQGNLMYDGDWHLFLIDHSRAFIEKKDLKGLAPPGRVDRALWNKMAALTPEQLQSTLGEWLTKKEMEAMLIRRDRMQQEISKMVAAHGEAFVFF